MKTLSVLGSTGTIGVQTLEVAVKLGLPVVALAAGRNLPLLAQQIREFSPQAVSIAPDLAPELRSEFPDLEVLEDAGELAAWPSDLVISAISGLAGLAPTLRSLLPGRTVALVNKEGVIAAGPLLLAEAQAQGCQILPVDSEPQALLQLLAGHSRTEVAALVITASGGPFLKGPLDLSQVTPEQALAHPRWKMGAKITIDSATLMNKGLEAIEASQLFGYPLDRIEVLVHPQSKVHGMLHMIDGSYLAHLAPTDMRLAIQFALSYPERQPGYGALDLSEPLEFFPPDRQRFPALELAYAAGRAGGLVPACLLAADEVAVSSFLAGKISFDQIPIIVEQVLENSPREPLSWESLEPSIAWAYAYAREIAC